MNNVIIEKIISLIIELKKEEGERFAQVSHPLNLSRLDFSQVRSKIFELSSEMNKKAEDCNVLLNRLEVRDKKDLILLKKHFADLTNILLTQNTQLESLNFSKENVAQINNVLNSKAQGDVLSRLHHLTEDILDILKSDTIKIIEDYSRIAYNFEDPHERIDWDDFLRILDGKNKWFKVHIPQGLKSSVGFDNAFASVKADIEFLNRLLSEAVFYNSFELVSLAVKAGANPNSTSYNQHLTPLMRAASSPKNTEHIMKFLLLSGANPDAKNSNGMTALMMLFEKHNDALSDMFSKKFGYKDSSKIRCLRIFLAARSDITIKDDLGRRVFFYAVKADDFDCVTELLNKKPEFINMEDSSEQTPIYYAQTKEMMALLIGFGADIFHETRKGSYLMFLVDNHLGTGMRDYFGQFLSAKISKETSFETLNNLLSHLNKELTFVRTYHLGGIGQLIEDLISMCESKILKTSEGIHVAIQDADRQR